MKCVAFAERMTRCRYQGRFHVSSRSLRHLLTCQAAFFGGKFSAPFGNRTSIHPLAASCIFCRPGLSSESPRWWFYGATGYRYRQPRTRHPVRRKPRSSPCRADSGSGHGCQKYPASSCRQRSLSNVQDKNPVNRIVGVGGRRPWPDHVRVDHGKKEIGILGIPAGGFKIDHFLNQFGGFTDHIPALHRLTREYSYPGMKNFVTPCTMSTSIIIVTIVIV